MTVAERDKAKNVICPHCKAAVRTSSVMFEPYRTHCMGCGAQLEITPFPELFNVSTLVVADAVAGTEEAACFYHPTKQASKVCDHCGCFLCALCSVDWHMENLCPACIQDPKAHGRKGTGSRTRFDRLVLVLAVLPVLLIWPTIITAPLVLFLIFFRWKHPGGFLVGRGRTRAYFVLAGFLALLQIAGWLVVGIHFIGGGI